MDPVTQKANTTSMLANGGNVIPFVDISPWTRGSDEAEMLKSAAELGRAFESTGFAVVYGHGVSKTCVSRMEQVMKNFLDGPKHVKDSVRARPIVGAQGFHAQGRENVAQLIGDFSRPPDLLERMTFANLHRLGLSSNSLGIFGDKLEEPKFPEVAGFREAVQDYKDAITNLWTCLTRMSEAALGMPPNYMDNFYGDARSTLLQLSRYVRTREDTDPVAEDGIALGAHTDSGGLTILYTTAPGLEVELADGWHSVPVAEDAFIINVGRLLSRWTNDRWLASVHRVRNLEGRFSMALFTSPRADAVIEPLPTCVEAGSLPKYAPVKVQDFMYQRHLLHIPPEQRKPEEREIPKEFWEAATAAKRSQTLQRSNL